MTESRSYVERIAAALERAGELAATFSHRTVGVRRKGREGPVTEADHALDELLYHELVEDGEGWLSEETVDDGHRLEMDRVWVVDPIDGTRDFLAGRPEWCVSVAMTERGQVVAAGILNPWTDETFLAERGGGTRLNGEETGVLNPDSVDGITVLASRSEVRWGMWNQFRGAPFRVVTMGSIAYKMALVGAGKADAVISMEPKNEWDVAAGVLLIEAAGGVVTDLTGAPVRFNRRDTLLDGVIAAGPRTHAAIRERLERPPPHIWTPGLR